jgi:pimeloyl-ACP methyl ester carboxylesterase
VAQGGDLGAVVDDVMAEQAPPELLGIHSNFPATVPVGNPPTSGLSPDEKRAYQQLKTLSTKHLGYATMMGTRPQTIGYSLEDSPVGLAAYILDHGDAAGQPGAAITSALLGQGNAAGDLTRDDLLDNITLYWLTNTGPSAARFFWENKVPLLRAVNVSIPAAITVFPGEIYQAPRSWAERAYNNLIYFHEADRGGHFAAWEQPQLFSEEVRAGFRSLR